MELRFQVWETDVVCWPLVAHLSKDCLKTWSSITRAGYSVDICGGFLKRFVRSSKIVAIALLVLPKTLAICKQSTSIHLLEPVLSPLLKSKRLGRLPSKEAASNVISYSRDIDTVCGRRPSSHGNLLCQVCSPVSDARKRS